MRRPQQWGLGGALLCFWLHACASLETAPPSERVSYGPFHALRIYRPQPPIEHLALLLSGDGGWGSPVDVIASRLRAQRTLVVGIDVRELFRSYERDRGGCVSPGADLVELARYLQERYGLAGTRPVLIGHSAGASLAYIALVESPPQNFSGALTLSFCADLDLSKTLCGAPPPRLISRTEGARLLPDASALPGTWFALHGLDDDVCPTAEAREFAAAIPGVHFVGIPGVGHSYHHLSRWWPSFATAWRQLSAAGTTPAAH